MKHQNKNYQIALDGPAGSGKSTIAKLLARKLGFTYVDSGAMYRATTLYLIENNLLDKSDKMISSHLKKIKINLKERKQCQIVILNNKDVTREIRTSIINRNVSNVSSKKEIREEMVKRQKKIGENGSIVMDGRDIGTAVFPNADLKIYLTASVYIRAIRRKKDLKDLSEKVSIKELIKQIQRRDDIDSSREISPLSKSQDSIVIDSSNLTIKEVLEQIVSFMPSQ